MKEQKILQLYGLKWNPFLPDVPDEALMKSHETDQFCFSVENLVMDGGFAMITGEPGLGKSVSLHILYNRLNGIRELKVGEITRPQSNLTDFYRELSDIFGVELNVRNCFGSFKSLREKFRSHLNTTLLRPVVIIDDAQEAPSVVLKELRILASDKFDSKTILTIILAGDHTLPPRFTNDDLMTIGTRIKARLNLKPWSKEELKHLLSFAIEKAGNPNLMSDGLKNSLPEHALGVPRIMMNMANQILYLGVSKETSVLDEKLLFELVDQINPKINSKQRRNL